jgi:3-oxoacyl-[acyl-carrier protein] reductase
MGLCLDHKPEADRRMGLLRATTSSQLGLGEEAIQSMVRHIPLGSLGEPEDIGYTAVFLASDAARFITGQTVIVDGGQTLPEIPV